MKLTTAAQAVDAIPSGATITVGGTVGRMLPRKVLRALEKRFLETRTPTDLTWFDPFPTGISGEEPLSHPGLLRRVVGGWYTPHPRLREMIARGCVEAYCYPLGTLSFLCQQMAAGRRGLLTPVGIGTYVDPRVGGARLNAATCEELVDVVTVAGDEYLWYRTFPVTVAIIRGETADLDGNLSLGNETITMNVLNQALAAKANGGLVIVQARRVVAAGALPARAVTIPGVLVDCVVIDPDQHIDEGAPDRDWLDVTARLPVLPRALRLDSRASTWRQWLHEGRIPDDAPPVLPVDADVIIGRRALLEAQRGAFVNVGAGLPLRALPAVITEEDLSAQITLSVETGGLGGDRGGGTLGAYIANHTAILDVPSNFSLYGGGFLDATFLSMIEFDREGNVNLLRHGDTIVGPGGSMDIAHATGHVVFIGTFRAGGIDAAARDGRLVIRTEGRAPRAVDQVQAVCFNGPAMAAAGKRVTYVTERAVFALRAGGPVLTEVAPGLDVERDILAQMEFAPQVAADCRPMDARLFQTGPIGIGEMWASALDDAAPRGHARPVAGD